MDRRALLLIPSALLPLLVQAQDALDTPQARAAAVEEAIAGFERKTNPVRPTLTGPAEPGNAAESYLESARALKHDYLTEQEVRLWLERHDAGRPLPLRAQAIYQERGAEQSARLLKAARCSRCEWGYDLRLCRGPFWVHDERLPPLQSLRTLASLSAMHAARVESDALAVELALATVTLGLDIARFPALWAWSLGAQVERDGYAILSRALRTRAISADLENALAERLSRATRPPLSWNLEAEHLGWAAWLVSAESKPTYRRGIEFRTEHQHLATLHTRLQAIVATKSDDDRRAARRRYRAAWYAAHDETVLLRLHGFGGVSFELSEGGATTKARRVLLQELRDPHSAKRSAQHAADSAPRTDAPDDHR